MPLDRQPGSIETGGNEVFRRHKAFDLEDAMAAAQKAATDAFKAAGMQRPKVVLNVHWTDGRGSTFVAGSAIPARTPKWLAEGLRMSAEEVENQ